MFLRGIFTVGLCLLIFCTYGQETEEELPKKQSNGFEAKIEGGYYGGVLINFNFVVYNSGFGAGFMGGYRVNDYFGVYGGVGIERLEDGVLIPFYADFESYFSAKKKGYINARIGYSTGFNNRSINIEYKYRGGMVFGLGVGRDLYTSDHMRMGIAISYNFRQAQYTYSPFEDEESLNTKFDYQLFSAKIVFGLR